MANKTNLKTLLVISLFLVAMGIGTSSVFATGTYNGGNGLEGSPFEINTPAQMNEIGQHSEDWGSYFILTADIDLFEYTDTAFHIIGNSPPFSGSFDGNGHTISNFTYTSTGTDYIGLFGYVGTGGEIKNLGMVDVNVDAGTGAAVGGLVGQNAGTVSNCYATANVSGDYWSVGGLVGYNWYGTVSNCQATGNVAGGDSVGGLVGRNYAGTVSNCYATGSVTGTSNVAVGGLVGYNSDGTISNCYATGTVMGEGYVGGLVGVNAYGTVSNCYAAGSVSGTSDVGGLVGYHNNGSYNSCFWDSDVNPGLTGVGNITDPAGVMGRTTAQMQTESTFTDYGWDFVNIWGIDEGLSYPYLLWQIPPVSCTDNDEDTYAVEGGECGPVDCNDTDENIFPGAAELCNGIDDDCDTIIDNGGDALCDDGLWCNGQETCGGASGCQSGTPVDCSDGVDCTDDVCDEINDQCLNTPNDDNCAVDGWYDTGNIQWVSGGQCTDKEQKEQEYRDYYCDGTLDCQYTVTGTQWVDTGSSSPIPNGTGCDDGDPFTMNDMCIDGVCNGQPDSDGDTIPDAIDNCPYTYNPGQADRNRDGIGDACQKDFDGDGFKDNEDNCPETPNPDQNDTDGDLRGNACDLCPDDPNDACVDVNTVIGPGGGTATNAAGTASVDIPPGALTEDTTISIIGETDISNYAIGRSPDNLEIGYIYTFEPNGLTFSVPVTITLTYEQVAIPGQNCTEPNCTGCGGVEPKLDVYYYDDVNGWEPQDANQDCASNTLTLEVEHFSSYVAIAIRDSDGDEVLDPNDNCPYVYNPDQADSDSDGIGDTCECYAANIDGVDPVNFEDFAMLATDWLLTVYDLAGDTNRDESVDLWDLAQLAQHWLSDCNEP